MSDVCPRCASKKISGKKFGFGDVTVYERSCETCDLFEYRRSTDPDFDAWFARWSTGEDDDEPDEAASGPGDDDPDPDKGQGTSPATAPAARVGAKKGDLLRDICHDVADDAPRLAYADAIADRLAERAEFIRLQVKRFRDESQRQASRGAPSAREGELRRRHAVEWAHYIEAYSRPYATDAPYRGWEFERGFVAEIRTDPDMVADPRGYLFDTAPIEHLDLTADGSVLAALAAPRVAQVRSFGLRDLALGDDDMVALARDARLDRCEWLDLRSNKIGWKGVAALAASPVVRAIPIVLLTYNPCDPAVQYSGDSQGGGESWLPAEGKELEAMHGQIRWLHLPVDRARPDRYHARSVDYVDL